MKKLGGIVGPIAIVFVGIIIVFVTIDKASVSARHQASMIADSNPESSIPPMLQVILLLLLVVILCALIGYIACRLLRRRCPRCKSTSIERIRKEYLLKAVEYQEGIIEYTYRCTKCGNTWKEQETYTHKPAGYQSGTVSGYDGSLGGGFSARGSWGGGSTSGGGAGSKW